ncbi:hypothetical protein V5799_004493 [Amblyomma americanum]|uniref:Uncharacterized protein n=1 Tax=Amblyomma americanum TaxID=6943 RepID=A0AAQ4D5Y6_AMBAM
MPRPPFLSSFERTVERPCRNARKQTMTALTTGSAAEFLICQKCSSHCIVHCKIARQKMGIFFAKTSFEHQRKARRTTTRW